MRIPRRFSLKLLLLVLTVTCVTLALRLWPIQLAKEFALIAEKEGLRAALHKVDQETKEELTDYAVSSNYPDLKLVSVDDVWHVLRSGRCRAIFRVRWHTSFSGGEDTLVVEFQPFGGTMHSVSRTRGFGGFTII